MNADPHLLERFVVISVPKSPLEDPIIAIITNSVQDLTNPQIRTKLHQQGVACKKSEINKTLHDLKDRGVLQTYVIDKYNYWKLTPCPLIEEVKECTNLKEIKEEAATPYSVLLLQVRQTAAAWKNGCPTNVLPMKPVKIINFIENSVHKGLDPDLLIKLTEDIVRHGWALSDS